MDLDELFPLIGEFGRYQKCILWLIILPLVIPNAFVVFNQLFMAQTPQHWCRIPILENILDPAKRRFYAIPKWEGEEMYEKCNRFAINWTQIVEEDPLLLRFQPNDSWALEPCLDGWEYNLTEVSSSVVIDFDLVCGKAMYPTYGLVLLNVGGPLGIFIFATINDRYGRKCSLTIIVAMALLCNTLTAFSPNIEFWMIARFALGLTQPALYHNLFILALEIVGPNYRSAMSVAVGSVFTVGLMTLAFITYYISKWRVMTLTTSVPFCIFFISRWFLPESPRWLLSAKKNEEAYKMLKAMARVNKKHFPESFLNQKETIPLHTDNATKLESEKYKNIGLLNLFKTPNMRIKTLLIAFLWFITETVYIGLSYYGPSLGNEMHFSFFLTSLVEIPSNLLCWYILDILGRKLLLSTLMIISGLSCLVTVLLPPDAQISILVLFLISKFAISASFLVIFTFAGELFPTEARGIGLATAAYVSGIGRIFVPFITYLGVDMLVLPLIILGIFSVIGGMLSLRLPETLHSSLPQTIEEGEEFGKNWSLSDCLKCFPQRLTHSTNIRN